MKTIKRVLLVSTYFKEISTIHWTHIQLLKRKGYEVHVAASDEYGGQSTLKLQGITCHSIPFHQKRKIIQNVMQLRLLQQHNTFEIIHLFTPYTAFLSRISIRKCDNVKVLYTVGNFPFYRGASFVKWLFFYPFEKWAVRWTDLLIVWNREDLHVGKKLGYQEGTSLFFVRGAGVRWQKEYDEFESGYEDRMKLIVCCIGDYNRANNQELLLQQWKRVEAHHPTAQLYLIGNGNEREVFEHLIRKKRLRNVHLIGKHHDEVAMIQRSTVVVYAGNGDIYPLYLVQAMSCKKPIVATDVRGANELVERDRTGFLVQRNDGEALVQHIMELIESPAKRERFGEQAFEKAKPYRIETVREQLANIYKRIEK